MKLQRLILSLGLAVGLANAQSLTVDTTLAIPANGQDTYVTVVSPSTAHGSIVKWEATPTLPEGCTAYLVTGLYGTGNVKGVAWVNCAQGAVVAGSYALWTLHAVDDKGVELTIAYRVYLIKP